MSTCILTDALPEFPHYISGRDGDKMVRRDSGRGRRREALFCCAAWLIAKECLLTMFDVRFGT
jgi:hypothetical protein